LNESYEDEDDESIQSYEGDVKVLGEDINAPEVDDDELEDLTESVDEMDIYVDEFRKMSNV
jgi:hypothetical protein